mgnify:CR=1 FL=1
MNQILIALIALANLIVAVTKAMASGVRLNEVLDTQPSLTDEGSSVQAERKNAARVAFEDVSFTYCRQPGAGTFPYFLYCKAR